MGVMMRIGIVISALWMIAGGVMGYEASQTMGEHAYIERILCLAKIANPKDQPDEASACESQFTFDYPETARNPWRVAAIYALEPLPFLWLFGTLIVWTVRWVKRGAAKH